VEGCQKSLGHPSWQPIVTNRYEITNNGEHRTERQNRDNHEKASSLHSPYSMHKTDGRD